MIGATLDDIGSGRFRVSGTLDASTVTDLLKQGEQRFAGPPQLDVDLANVADSDSAGLALLIEWLRITRQRGQRIHFSNLPRQIVALARISEVEELILQNGTARAEAVGA